jgi:hypothetical protein
MIKAIGRYLPDGEDVIDIDDIEKLAFVKVVNKMCDTQYGQSDTFSVYEAYFMGEDISIDVQELREKLPDTGKIGFFSIEQDYHGCRTLDDMFDHYSNNKGGYGSEDLPSKKDIKREMNVMFRAKKLKKINKLQNND